MGPLDFEDPGFPGTSQVKMTPRSWPGEHRDQTFGVKPRKVPKTRVLCLEEFRDFS